MPSFTPPTVPQGSSDPFFGRYMVDVGQSVVRVNGSFQTTPYPWIGELVGEEGTDWFLGGRTYPITDAISAELSAAGYSVTQDPGYGDSGYGTNGYGD